MQLYIFGTGAHARKIYHYAVDGGWQVSAFVDEASYAVTPIVGVPLLQVSELPEPTVDCAMFIAIGRAMVRRRLMECMAAAGWRLPPLVHRKAWVSPDVILEDGVLVAAGAVVESGSTVARGTIIDIGVLVDHNCRIGAFCHLRAGEVYNPGADIAPIDFV